MYDTVQVAWDCPSPAVRVQVAEGLKDPELSVLKRTVPVGFVGVGDVSVTLAVQLVATLTTTEPGEQVTTV